MYAERHLRGGDLRWLAALAPPAPDTAGGTDGERVERDAGSTATPAADTDPEAGGGSGGCTPADAAPDVGPLAVAFVLGGLLVVGRRRRREASP